MAETKIQFSEEQIKNYNEIGEELVKKHKIAKLLTEAWYHPDTPRTGQALMNIVDELEPLVQIFLHLDLREGCDREGLEIFVRQINETSAKLPYLYNVARSLNVAYREFWEGMDLLDKAMKALANEIVVLLENEDEKESKGTEEFKSGTQKVADMTKEKDAQIIATLHQKEIDDK
ncbi:MAG: hypothetical protein J6W40_01745 [Alphaproteobacteria bacterium]|nr:hypothetical protein [Alphaproteobacteria bacterium]